MKLVFEKNDPFICLFSDFLGEDECKYLIHRAEPKLVPSTVVAQGNVFQESHPGRTSSGMCFSRGETTVIDRIERRIAEVTRSPVENGEGIQVLRYEEGQHYLPHYDYFDPARDGYDKYLQRGGQRIYSAIMYLSDDFKDGETEFPLLGLRVPPVKGNMLVFSNLRPGYQLDERTLHGGVPPAGGTKYIATKWIRQYAY